MQTEDGTSRAAVFPQEAWGCRRSGRCSAAICVQGPRVDCRFGLGSPPLSFRLRPGGGLVSRTYRLDRRAFSARALVLLLVLSLSLSWTATHRASETSGRGGDISVGHLLSAVGQDIESVASAASHAVVSATAAVADRAGSVSEGDWGARAVRGLVGGAITAAGLVGAARPAAASSSSGGDPGINPASVSTLAGSGTNATVDGTGSGASFTSMGGVVVVGGYAYVGTLGSIRKVDVSSGATTTLAGDASATGCVDSATPSAVRFKQIIDVATDGTYLYATQVDCGAGATDLIRKVTISTGATTTLTTAPSAATFSGHVTYSGGYLFFVGGTTVTKIDVSTVPDTSSTFATLANTGRGVVGDGTNLWVSDGSTSASSIQSVTLSSASVSTLVSVSDGSVWTDSIEAAGSSLYLASGTALRRYSESDGSWSNIAGASDGYADGTATDAWFSSQIRGIGTDGSGLYVADSLNYRLRKAVAGTALPSALSNLATTRVSMSLAQVSTFAGNATGANVDGTGTAASFWAPEGVVVVGGDAYVGTQSAIRKVSLSTGVVSTFAGSDTSQTCVDSTDPSQVRFSLISALATDGYYLYSLSDDCNSANLALRRTSLASGATSTVTINIDVHARQITVGPGGIIYYIADSLVYSVDPRSAVATSVASLPSTGSSITADASNLWVSSGLGSGASYIDRIALSGGYPVTVVASATDNRLSARSLVSTGDYLYGQVLIPNGGSADVQIVRISKADGVYVPIAGSGVGYADGLGLAAQFQTAVLGLASDGTNLWAVDTTNVRLRELAQASGPSTRESWVPNASELGYCRTCAGDPVDGASGNYYESFTDLNIPGRSPALDETRTYGSLNASYSGPFGYGWSSTYDMHLQLGVGSPPATVDVVQENDAFVSFTWNGSAYVAPSRVLATLVLNGDGTYTFTRRAQEQFVFDATGLLIKAVARDGFAGSPGTGVPAAYTTTLSYASGRLSTVTDAAGRTLTFSYGTNGKVSGIADSTGRTVGYGYDGSGNLTDVTDVLSGNTHFTYDANHLLLTVRDPRGNTVLTNTYDNTGRTLTQTDGLSRETFFDYTSIPGSTKITDPKGNVIVDTFTNNMLMSETKGYGTANAATWNYTYDPSTLGVATVQDPNLNTTSYTWDPSGNPLTKTDALMHETIWTYNSFGEPLTVEDPNLVTTTDVYNAAGDLTSTSRPLVGSGTTQTTTYTYGDSAHPGDVTSITDPRSKVWLSSYDSSTGDLLSQTTPLGDETTYTYNAAGQRLTMVSPNGNVTGGSPSAYTTTYVPDAAGHVTSVTDPLSHQTQQMYDADGNLHQVIDPLTQTTTYTYDVANELTQINRPDTSNLYNSYWPDGSLETQTDGAGNVTTYNYDPLGRLSSIVDPKLRSTGYTYDGAGNLKTVLDAESRTTTNGYDIADRLTSVTYSDGVTPNVAYTYDADGQQLTMVDGTGTTTTAWDSLHRLTSQPNGAGQTMSYGYDLANNLTTITYPGTSHTVTRAYDDSGRLHTITDWLTHTTTYNYDHNANLTSQNYPNSTTATYTPDAANRLMNIADTISSTTFASFGYTRNNADLLTGVTPTGVGQANETYGYSALNQLNAVNSSSYTFDSADNLTGMPNGTKLAYDTANQLCWTASTTAACASPPTGATTYSYGNNGERTAMTPPTASDPTVNYAYDQANRLADVRGAGYRTAVLASNPLGYWRLGDASGSAAADSSGMAHPGVYTGGGFTYGVTSALTTDTNNKAATFNGTSSYVSVTNPVLAGQSTTFSAEAWVKGSAITGRYFLTEGNTSSTTPFWGLATDGTTGTHAVFTVRDDASHVAMAIGTKTILDGTWHHVIGVRNGTTVSVYVDGALDATTTLSTLSTLTLGLTTVGALHRITTVSNYFGGSIDEAALYGTSLTAAQIADHYQAARSNYAGTIHPNAPSAYWRLGETSGTAAADTSGNAHTGTYTGGYTLSQSGALSGDGDKAVKFNGTSAYVTSGSVAAGQSSTFSAEAWVKGSATTGRYLLAEGNTTSATPFWGLSTDGTTGTLAVFTIRDNAGHVAMVIGTRTIMDGNWHHVVGVRSVDGSGNAVLTLYVDGVQDGTMTSSTLGVPTVNNNTIVGALKRVSTVSNYFNGTLDEVALYPTALNAATITRHYYNAKNSQPETATYTYDGTGTRTAKTVAGNTTNFTWDTAEGLPLLASDGTNQYIYGPGGVPVEQVNISTSTPVYYHQDQQASTRVLTDQSGNVLATYSFDALGNATASSGIAQTPLRYDGEYRDNETGFVYLRARYYDPATAEFLTRDPEDASTRSAYGYVNNNPLNVSDPSGLDPQCRGMNATGKPCEVSLGFCPKTGRPINVWLPAEPRTPRPRLVGSGIADPTGQASLFPNLTPDLGNGVTTSPPSHPVPLQLCISFPGRPYLAPSCPHDSGPPWWDLGDLVNSAKDCIKDAPIGAVLFAPAGTEFPAIGNLGFAFVGAAGGCAYGASGNQDLSDGY